ncbi:putative RNA-directed DNA polymerase, eukaryota, reverse transcriptase zinc-binding domain protein [Tanacetum coccineum]
MTATPLSTASFFNSIVQDFQDDPNNEKDQRSSQEYVDELAEEFQEMAKRLFKRNPLRFLNISIFTSKNNGLVVESFDWDEEKVSSNVDETLNFKVLMDLAMDFEKAFDSISWKYLDFVLQKLGFGLTWRAWINACLVSSRTSILVNRSPTSEFFVKRGLRQGDPLSPLLFTIVMEGLHMSLQEACHSGLIHGIKIGSSNITLSHMFYVDDVVITTDWNPLNMENIICILHVFYLALGLKINIHKSNVYGVGVSDNEIFSMANNTRCSPGAFPFVNWLNVLASHDKGGLGIGSLRSFNLSLLKKWRWRFISNANALWAKVIKAFHSQEGGFDLNVSPSSGICGSSIRFWKDLWTGNSPLYLRYNRLFWLDRDKDCLLSDRFIDNQWSWNWSRYYMGTRNAAYLSDMINEITPLELSSDRAVCYWSMANDGMFSVSSTCHIIDSHLLPALDMPTQWDNCIPRKSSNHVFFDCDNAKAVWSSVRNWCDLSFPAYASFVQWKLWFDSWQVSYLCCYFVVALEVS